MALAGRQRRSLLLAAIAVLGLVVIPLLHAEEHCREEQDDDEEVVAGPREAAWIGPLDHHDHDHRHGHSHGEGAAGPHGAGTLSHLGIALHAAPRLLDLPVVAPKHPAPVAFDGQLRNALRYLVPEWSQGPPTRC